MTQLAVAKARKTRRQTLKMPRTAKKLSKAHNSSFVGIALVGWLILTASYFGVSIIRTAYAEMTEPMVYEAIPVEVVNPIVNKLTTKAEIRDYVLSEAKKAGVHVAKIEHIVKNESQFNVNAVGDMNITCKRTGKPVRARGAWQWTECFHPEISDECAFDIKCSTELALEVIARSKKACIKEWTQCRAWYNKQN